MYAARHWWTTIWKSNVDSKEVYLLSRQYVGYGLNPVHTTLCTENPQLFYHNDRNLFFSDFTETKVFLKNVPVKPTNGKH